MQSSNRTLRVAGFGLLFCSLVACSAILGLPSPALDDSIGGDSGADGSGQDAQTGDSPGPNVDASDAPQTCGDVSTSLANCGACGHDCTGGKCKNGLCELTGFLDGPIELALSATDVFVSNSSSGSVIRCTKNGCGANPLLISPGGVGIQPWGIAVNDTHVFFAGFAYDGGVYRVQLDGGNRIDMTLPFPLTYPTGLALDATKVYWTNWNTPGSVNSCPLAGCGAGPTLVGAPQDVPEAVTTAASGAIVWTRQSDGSVMKCDDGTCSTGMKVVATGGHPFALATDAANVYWVDRVTGKVAMCSLTGAGCGASPVVIADGQIFSQGIGVVGNTVYWSNGGTNPPVEVDGGGIRDGVIRKCTIGPSCTPIDVATGQFAPYGLAVDSKSVYWVNEGIDGAGNGTLMKAPL